MKVGKDIGCTKPSSILKKGNNTMEEIKWYDPNEKGFTIYLCSRSVKHEFAWFKTEKEAVEFCEMYNWEYTDENTFVWDMEIEED